MHLRCDRRLTVVLMGDRWSDVAKLGPSVLINESWYYDICARNDRSGTLEVVGDGGEVNLDSGLGETRLLYPAQSVGSLSCPEEPMTKPGCSWPIKSCAIAALHPGKLNGISY